MGKETTIIMAIKKLTYSTLADTNLEVSEVGFGTYRISAENPEHKEALKYALQKGINFIDTSSNYMNGSAEHCIGKVIYECIEDNELTRKDLVIMTKGGYLQGTHLEHSNSLTDRGEELPDKVVFSESLEHCIHPKCLNIQLESSLNLIGTEYIDIYLLHNPEYYLTWAHKNKLTREEAREEFYRRIKLSFEFLETKVSEGKIKYYGVSSNTIGYEETDYEFVSIQKLLSIAESISNNHHCKIIQAPCNLIENNVAVIKNNDGKTAIEFAESKNLAFITNRTFNAIVNNNLFRLVDHDIEEGISWLEVDDNAQNLLQLEMQIEQLEIDHLALSPEDEIIIRDAFKIGSELQSTWQDFKSIEAWKESIRLYIYPRIDYAVSKLLDSDQLTKEHESWIFDYVAEMNTFLKSISLYLKVDASNRIDNLRAKISHKKEEIVVGKSFSQTALSYLRGISGVSSSLVGLRKTDYVDDVLSVIQIPSTPVDPEDIPNILE
jgi:aryl-alcohol dehydrogenase-like predicted oxidoreductase